MKHKRQGEKDGEVEEHQSAQRSRARTKETEALVEKIATSLLELVRKPKLGEHFPLPAHIENRQCIVKETTRQPEEKTF